MNKKILIRIAYWWGAIGDALLAIEMYFSAFLGTSSPFTGLGLTIPGGVEYQYAICLAATLVLAWTFLLIWADRKPFERKDMLLLTIIPVVGIQLSTILAFQFHLISLGFMIGYTTQRLIFAIYYLICYYIALKESLRKKT